MRTGWKNSSKATGRSLTRPGYACFTFWDISLCASVTCRTSCICHRFPSRSIWLTCAKLAGLKAAVTPNGRFTAFYPR